MRKFYLVSATVLSASIGLTIGSAQSASALIWDWNYSGDNIKADGTFTTNDIPDNLGYYLINEITGKRNGEKITGLFPTEVPIPGNEPFKIDNLISLNTQQLTGDGFGYSTSGGNFSSPFFASFLPTPGYLEVFSAPPLIPGFENLGSEDSELPINFSAKIRTVPIPESSPEKAFLGILGLMGARQLMRSLRGVACPTQVVSRSRLLFHRTNR
jgi:hypothetical protein